jgi:hypothetical protein
VQQNVTGTAYEGYQLGVGFCVPEADVVDGAVLYVNGIARQLGPITQADPRTSLNKQRWLSAPIGAFIAGHFTMTVSVYSRDPTTRAIHESPQSGPFFLLVVSPPPLLLGPGD